MPLPLLLICENNVPKCFPIFSQVDRPDSEPARPCVLNFIISVIWCWMVLKQLSGMVTQLQRVTQMQSQLSASGGRPCGWRGPSLMHDLGVGSRKKPQVLNSRQRVESRGRVTGGLCSIKRSTPGSATDFCIISGTGLVSLHGQNRSSILHL